MTKIVVTGGSGFIGSHLCERLLAIHDTEVVNIDAWTYAANQEHTRELSKDARYRFVHGTIGDIELLLREFSSADAVIHCAAESHVDNSIKGPAVFVETNTRGTYNILEAARQANVPRILYMSTDEVYGSIVDGSFTEQDPLAPRSPYSASKAAGDLFCKAYHETFGLPVLVTRCTNNFGPRQHDEKFIPTAIRALTSGRKVPVYGTGDNVRDWISVEDHCLAVLHVLKHGKCGEAYNVGAGNEIANIGLARKIARILGTDPDQAIEFVEDRKGHDFRYSVDTTKLRALGWFPQQPFEKRLSQTVTWYQQKYGGI